MMIENVNAYIGCLLPPPPCFYLSFQKSHFPFLLYEKKKSIKYNIIFAFISLLIKRDQTKNSILMSSMYIISMTRQNLFLLVGETSGFFLGCISYFTRSMILSEKYYAKKIIGLVFYRRTWVTQKVMSQRDYDHCYCVAFIFFFTMILYFDSNVIRYIPDKGVIKILSRNRKKINNRKKYEYTKPLFYFIEALK